MESATENPTKKTRFDATAQARHEEKSPTSLAQSHIQNHIVSLHSEVHDILLPVALKFLEAQSQVHRKMNLVKSLYTEDPNHQHIPCSACVNFELKVSKEAEQMQEYTNLVERVLDLTKNYQIGLKGCILDACKLGAAILEKHAANALALGLFAVLKTILVSTGHDSIDPHKIVSSLLDRHHENILDPIPMDKNAFSTIYEETNSATLPEPFVSPTRRDNDPAPSLFATQPSDADPPQPACPRPEETEIANILRLNRCDLCLTLEDISSSL